MAAAAERVVAAGLDPFASPDGSLTVTYATLPVVMGMSALLAGLDGVLMTLEGIDSDGNGLWWHTVEPSRDPSPAGIPPGAAGYHVTVHS